MSNSLQPHGLQNACLPCLSLSPRVCSISCPLSQWCWASQVVLVVKNPPANAGDIGDLGSILGSGRSPEGGHGNPLQSSCLKNPMDRGAWWVTVHRVGHNWVTKHSTAERNLYFLCRYCYTLFHLQTEVWGYWGLIKREGMLCSLHGGKERTIWYLLKDAYFFEEKLWPT